MVPIRPPAAMRVRPARPTRWLEESSVLSAHLESRRPDRRPPRIEPDAVRIQKLLQQDALPVASLSALGSPEVGKVAASENFPATVPVPLQIIQGNGLD